MQKMAVKRLCWLSVICVTAWNMCDRLVQVCGRILKVRGGFVKMCDIFVGGKSLGREAPELVELWEMHYG